MRPLSHLCLRMSLYLRTQGQFRLRTPFLDRMVSGFHHHCPLSRIRAYTPLPRLNLNRPPPPLNNLPIHILQAHRLTYPVQCPHTQIHSFHPRCRSPSPNSHSFSNRIIYRSRRAGGECIARIRAKILYSRYSFLHLDQVRVRDLVRLLHRLF